MLFRAALQKHNHIVRYSQLFPTYTNITPSYFKCRIRLELLDEAIERNSSSVTRFNLNRHYLHILFNNKLQLGVVIMQEKYSMPEEIKALITSELAEVFVAQLGEVFRDNVSTEIKKWFCDEGYYFEHTQGWDTALKQTADIAGCPLIYEHYCDLEWYERDVFDDLLHDAVCSLISGGRNS